MELRKEKGLSMSEAQEQHIGQIMLFMAQRSGDKYRQGTIEHTGNLWDLTDDELLENALEEVIDLQNYLVTLIMNRKERASK